MTDAPDLGHVFCDLVMKGGITSGVVYPSAVAELAARYKLRNIGGASAGAIAAGAAAAAEFRRQTDPANGMAGFKRLETLADELGRPPEGFPSKHSRLFHLFAPSRLSEPIFSVLAGMLNRRSWKSRAGFGLLALLRAFPGAAVAGVALWALALMPLTLALARETPGAGRWLGIATSVLTFFAVSAFAFAGIVAFAVFRSAKHFARVMYEQEFGLCTGMPERGSTQPAALTEWLYDLFQSIAAKPPSQPLTFGDLERVEFRETPNQPGIVLRMMTTCLTAGRPYTLPIRERLYFDPIDFRRLFPADVVDWMTGHPWARRKLEDESADALARANAEDGKPRPLIPIPAPADFPVIVGVRMSLSFPILLSAVPLYRLTVRKDDENHWMPCIERLYFTDGGVCSNLPIHLFDSPLPAWPTFAINLRDDLPEGSPDDERVVPPKRGRSYQGERYLISREPQLGATASFFAALVNTMQNWRDMLQRAAPGARERVFTVRHTEEEGGLNLDMDTDAIRNMSASGKATAKAILTTYLAPEGSAPHESDWQYHRWVRLRLLLPLLRDFLGQLCGKVTSEMPRPTIREFLTTRPMGRSYELNRKSGDAGADLLEALAAASAAVPADADLTRTIPKPPGTLKVTPDF
jgi:hypothetical protein